MSKFKLRTVVPTVFGLNFDMCMISNRTKTHYLSEINQHRNEYSIIQYCMYLKNLRLQPVSSNGNLQVADLQILLFNSMYFLLKYMYSWHNSRKNVEAQNAVKCISRLQISKVPRPQFRPSPNPTENA